MKCIDFDIDFSPFMDESTEDVYFVCKHLLLKSLASKLDSTKCNFDPAVCTFVIYSSYESKTSTFTIRIIPKSYKNELIYKHQIKLTFKF